MDPFWREESRTTTLSPVGHHPVNWSLQVLGISGRHDLRSCSWCHATVAWPGGLRLSGKTYANEHKGIQMKNIKEA